MSSSCRAGNFLLCLSCLLTPALAQQLPAGASTQPPPISAPNLSDRNLTLDVVVADHSGKSAAGLEEKDFVVRDNGQPVKVLGFRAVTTAAPDEPPVRIILMVDEVNTSFTSVAYERSQIDKFLKQNGGKLTHPMSMGFFSDAGTEIENGSSTDGNALMAVFDQHVTALRTIRRSTGFYGAQERLQLSLNAMGGIAAKEKQVPGRKIVIWISPGWPLLSGPRMDLSGKDQQRLFGSIVSMSTALRQARVTVYSIDPLGMADAGSLRMTYYENFLKPAKTYRQVEIGDLGLQVLARQTGGLALNSSNDLTNLIDRCVADADTFYRVTVPMAPAEQPNEFHEIDVKVETPGLTARTRNGYYAQP